MLGGVIAVFVSAIGMFQVFTSRVIVDPFLNLGYVALYGFTLYFGYKVTKKPVLEGMEPPKVGPHNMVAGLIVGAIAGAIVGGFLLLTGVVDLRDPLINVSRSMVALLAFERALGTGALFHLGIGAVVGATYPRAVAEARKLMPQAVLLLPGIGAQGATPADVARAFTSGPASALVSVSRSVIYAFRVDGADWRKAAAAEAARLRGEVWAVSGW